MKPTGARYQEVAEKYCDDAVKQVDLIRSGSKE
jgi:cytochrome c551/c552